MQRCKVCGKRFRLKKESRYEIVKKPVGLMCLTESTKVYEAFDRPRCGCQTIVNIKEPINWGDIEEEASEDDSE